jgi:hypothetical protein
MPIPRGSKRRPVSLSCTPHDRLPPAAWPPNGAPGACVPMPLPLTSLKHRLRSRSNAIGLGTRPMRIKAFSNRWAQPGEMAGAVVFLASAASSYVTGTVFYVDAGLDCGGWSLPTTVAGVGMGKGEARGFRFLHPPPFSRLSWHLMTTTTASFIAFAATDQDDRLVITGWVPVDQALGARGGVATNDTNGVQFVDLFSAGQQ